MFATFFVVCALLCHIILVPVTAIPLRVVGPGEGRPEEKSLVKTATAHAHEQVLEMERVANQASNRDPYALEHVHNAFGNNPNLPAIQQHIQTLKNGKYGVQVAHSGKHGMGETHPTTGHVSFGTAFYSPLTEDHERAGSVLHEASHSILGTKDVWSASGQPLDKGKPGPGEHSGYKDSGLHDIKNRFSQNMHQNADSWRVFGHSCTHGLRRSLTRRALAEPDLAKRAVILEIRNAACALPSAKSKNGAKANKVHETAKAHKGTSHTHQ